MSYALLEEYLVITILLPIRSESFDIYMSNQSQEALLEEFNDWSTYYSAKLRGEAIAQEMPAH